MRRNRKASEEDFQAHGFGLWGVYWRGGAELVGFCGLRQADVFQEPELLFAVADQWRRRGLGYESAGSGSPWRNDVRPRR